MLSYYFPSGVVQKTTTVASVLESWMEEERVLLQQKKYVSPAEGTVIIEIVQIAKHHSFWIYVFEL